MKSGKRLLVLGVLATVGMIGLAQPSSAADRRVEVINKTSHDIVNFYASNVGTNSWEEDILGVSVLPPNSSAVINIDDGSGYCKFDFKAVFSDGGSAVKGGNNVCELETFTFTE